MIPEHQAISAALGSGIGCGPGERRDWIDHHECEMAGMNGAILRQVRQRDPAQARRIIFITGDTVSPDTRSFLQRVSNPVLSKPFKIGPLRDAIESVLSQ
jgi:CheY-like chemotaxis protein